MPDDLTTNLQRLLEMDAAATPGPVTIVDRDYDGNMREFNTRDKGYVKLYVNEPGVAEYTLLAEVDLDDDLDPAGANAEHLAAARNTNAALVRFARDAIQAYSTNNWPLFNNACATLTSKIRAAMGDEEGNDGSG